MKMDPERLCQTCMERPARKANSKYCVECVTELQAKRGKEYKAIAKKVDTELRAEREAARRKAIPRDHVAERLKREARQGCSEHERLKPTRDKARARDKARKNELKVVHKEQTAKEVALKELSMRELARRRLMPFIIRNQPSYLPGWVHTEICAELEAFSAAVTRKESPRLMIWVPPRHGKSMIASWHFPPWHLGKNPDHEVIAVSYAASLALGFSRKARALVQDDDFKKLFPKCKLNRDILNAENWQTTEGGGYRAAGVGGPMTGTGAHVLIIDDPVKNWEEADSETVRGSTAEWYASTAYTRLAPGGGVLIIQTRWHEDDLSGRLSELMDNDPEADQYRIIDYPAVAIKDEKHRKQGEPLHPERYDAKALKRYENNVGPRVWNALYQQRPAPDEGAYFKKPYFKYYDIGHLPVNLDYYASWDLAITVKEDNDPTCGFVVGVDGNGIWWIVDRIHGRWETYDIVDNIINTMLRWNPSVTWIEKDKVQLAIGPVLTRVMQERRVNNFVEEVPTGRKDKVMRARTLQGMFQMGKVYIPAEAPWLADFENEMLKFPHVKHDDQVDALAHMANQLEAMGGSPPPRSRHSQPISWKDKLGGLISKRSSPTSHLSA
jgi:predicted phage terminase large subunit-like protein